MKIRNIFFIQVKLVSGLKNKMTQQNKLLVDAGNSFVKWSQTNSVGENNLSTMLRQEYPGNITASYFIKLWQELDSPEKVVVSCVASDQVWQAIEQACEQLWEIQVERILAVKEELGLVNAYEQPEKLGSDRWCAMIGACQKVDTAVIMVDCGSALTIDVISGRSNDSGERAHLGGYILPGIGMMKKSLGTHTADVNVAKKPTEPSLNPSTTTTACVDSAIYLAAVKLIEAVFEQQHNETESVACLLTGGDASVISGLLSFQHIVEPDLIMQGLLTIAESRTDKKNNKGFADI